MQLILNQENPVHNVKLFLFKIHLNIILQTNLGPATDFFTFPTKIVLKQSVYKMPRQTLRMFFFQVLYVGRFHIDIGHEGP